jgi:plasmid stabilization system protein ParE
MDYDDTDYEFNLSPFAKKELDEILLYYTKEAGFDIAKKFADRFETTAELLEMFPNSGVQLAEIPDVKSSRIPKFPHRIYYTVDDGELEVVAISIYHSKRDLGKLIPELRKRLKKN